MDTAQVAKAVGIRVADMRLLVRMLLNHLQGIVEGV